jgi:hypothetical protein
MRTDFWVVPFAILLLLIVCFSSRSYQVQNVILDVSWPNCGKHLNETYQFGIIGATGGLNFRKNACLTQEVSWFQGYALYMNTGYPGASYGDKYQHAPKNCSKNNNYCLAYNWGYNAALFAIAYANSSNVHSFLWWLDVETVNSWSVNGDINRQSLLGALSAIQREAIFPSVGFYAYPGQWATLTGSWQNNYPAWVATGTTEKQAANIACRQPSFSDGTVVLTQYTKMFDQNIDCRTSAFAKLNKI